MILNEKSIYAIIYSILLVFQINIADAAGPGKVENLMCDSGHNALNPISKGEIKMLCDYPSGYTSTTISGFYYAFNTISDYTITSNDSWTTQLIVTSDNISADNVDYYFHIAAMDNDFISGPNIGSTENYGPMKVDTVKPSGANISGPSTTDKIDVTLSLGVNSAIQMCISNVGYGSDCNWEPVASSKSWNLLEGAGDKTVYVQYIDSAGNTSDASTLIKYEPETIIIRPIFRSIPSLSDWGKMIFIFLLITCAIFNVKKNLKVIH